MKRYMFLITCLLMVLQGSAQDTWSLSKCIEYAVTNNITVKKAELTKSTSEANYSQSKTARFPNLTAGGSQSLTNGSSIDPITSDYVSQVVRSTSLNLSSQVTLYNGGTVSNQIKQNKLLVEQNDLYVAEAKNNITLSIVEAYLQALYYKEGIEVATVTLTTSEKQLEQSKAKYEAGSIAAKAYADVQSQYANNKYSLVVAKNNYAAKVLVIKQLLELEPQQNFEIETPILPADLQFLIPNKNDVYQLAIKFMPEIKASETQIKVNSLDLEIARAGHRPTVTLSGGVNTGYTNTQTNPFFKQMKGNVSESLSLNLNIPIFDRGVTKTKIQNSKIEIEKSQLTLTSTNKDLYQKIETAWQNAVSTQSELESLLAAMNAAKVAFDLSQQQYNLGALSATDLVVSQNAYISAEQKYLQTKYTCVLYYQLLQFYQGNPIKL